MHHYLAEHLRDIERKYDYRYSQLTWVFARLIREAWLTEKDIAGLSEDKLEAIRKIALP